MSIRHYWVSAAMTAMLLIIASPVMADDYQDAARLLKEGKHSAALEKIDSALTANPKDARARFLRGLILTEQNKTQEAIKVFTSLTEDYPELPEPYNNLAVLYAAQGQYEQARKSLEMAIRTHPSYAVAHENLGDVYAKMASEAYDKALELDRSNKTAQMKLSLIRELFSGTATPAIASASAAPTGVAQKVERKSETAGPAVQPKETPPTVAKEAEADQTSEILSAVNGWAKAWSDKDVAAYLSFYSPQFEPPGKQGRQSWEAARRDRLTRPKFINVTVSSLTVSFEGSDRAKVSFRQSYKSDTINSAGNKTLTMVRSGDRWLILQEQFED